MSTLVVLPDLENMGIAVGILLLLLVSTDICCRGRHRVTTGNCSMGEPLKCAD